MQGEAAHRPGALSGLLSGRRDVLWAALWIAGVAVAWIWFGLELNAPARALLASACLVTLTGSAGAVALALIAGWGTALLLYRLESARSRSAYLALTFLLNLLRSVPQIVGMLVGYVIVTALTLSETLRSESAIVLATSTVTALFVFQEVADLIRERIRHFSALEFVDALLVCGVPLRVVINREILLRNSMASIVQKAVALFGRVIFLICSIDFIISVGLSTDVSLANFPVTLGSMLARLDSKQDILAIGAALTDPRVIPTLLVEHLQGIGVAFLIVYTLVCVHRIAGGMMERYRL